MQCASMKSKSLFGIAIGRLYVLMVLSLLAVLCAEANAAAPTYWYYRPGSSNTTYYPTGQANCDAQASQSNPVQVFTIVGTDMFCKSPSGSTLSTVAKLYRCSATVAPNTSKPFDQQCADTVANTCNGYDTPELYAAQGYYSLKNPVCTWDDPATKLKSTCTGSYNGKQVTENFNCKNTGNVADTTGLVPKPVPDPPPPVEVSWPKCPVGSYSYIDLQDGTSSCSVAEPANNPNDPANCTNGYVGTVNGNLVCLPANPAPATAKAAADSATAKAEQAKASAGTQTAADAAKQAAIDAQKAKDASDSVGGAGGTLSDSQRAIDAAKRAAGYGGVPYNGPGGALNGTGGGSGGTGTGGTGTVEVNVDTCGLPGKPKCAIDETGTPTNGNAVFGTAKDALDTAVTAHTDALQQITSEDGKDTSWGWLPSVPHSTCTPVQFADLGTLDWCATAPAIEEVMSWLWSLTAVIFIIAMTSSTIKGN